MRKLLSILALTVLMTIVASAQSFVALGPQAKKGSFSLYDIPDSTLGSAYALGAAVEGAYDFKVGSATIAPRVLASLERNFTDKSYKAAGPNFTQFDLRPEAEVRAKLGEFEPLVAVGLNYTEASGGSTQLNPILGAGVQYEGIRASVYRFFPDHDNGNARGILYRVDYSKNLSPVGVRVSGELFFGRSEILSAPTHPGYEGHTYTLRVMLYKAAH